MKETEGDVDFVRHDGAQVDQLSREVQPRPGHHHQRPRQLAHQRPIGDADQCRILGRDCAAPRLCRDADRSTTLSHRCQAEHDLPVFRADHSAADHRVVGHEMLHIEVRRDNERCAQRIHQDHIGLRMRGQGQDRRKPRNSEKPRPPDKHRHQQGVGGNGAGATIPNDQQGLPLIGARRHNGILAARDLQKLHNLGRRVASGLYDVKLHLLPSTTEHQGHPRSRRHCQAI
mmetsp:Transcript_2537/g.7296  ORF Transcript_2537/g.7296 Transcript_2537/m.7296 type:complete len:230 (+) Transcript_2537:63-752(+)